MKSSFKTIIIMIFIFILLIPMQTTVKASTFTSMDTKRDVVVTKPWTVSFNKSLSVSSVNNTNIKVVGEGNKSIEIKVILANGNKSVIVQPVGNYQYNKPYTLIITQKVTCEDGKPLAKEIRMNFTTKASSIKSSEITVCIDPAQYYTENIGATGAKAKDINLSTALKLGGILKTRGFNVVYTRTSDVVPWSKINEDDAKATIAKNAKADVFLSIHTNSASNIDAKGIETYYMSNSTSSKLLASSMQVELVKATEAKDRGIKVAGETANFKILKKTSCPSVVIELGFLSNKEEEKLLISAEYQNNLAKGIANGLMNYLGFNNTDNNFEPIIDHIYVSDATETIKKGDNYSLPSTIIVTKDTGEKEELAVVWNVEVVDTSKAGVYVLVGTIIESDLKVKLTLNIIEVNKSIYKVVLDAGHGGKDPGAIGRMGTKEKDIVLAITLKVGDILVKNGVETIYTRTTDKTQTLKEKTDIANAAKPNYFVSIHANAFSNAIARGIETFYLSGNVAGEKLAKAVQTELIKATGRVDRGIKTTTGFYVVKNVKATAILVETLFLSNLEEEKLLITDKYQDKLAKAIATGILKSLGITGIL
jgi:N-acetylmuramoyl-L-alanine amidase